MLTDPLIDINNLKIDNNTFNVKWMQGNLIYL